MASVGGAAIGGSVKVRGGGSRGQELDYYPSPFDT